MGSENCCDDVCFRAGTKEVVITSQPGFANFVGVLHRLTGGI